MSSENRGGQGQGGLSMPFMASWAAGPQREEQEGHLGEAIEGFVRLKPAPCGFPQPPRPQLTGSHVLKWPTGGAWVVLASSSMGCSPDRLGSCQPEKGAQL